MQTAFVKYEGAGNDFILLDARDAATGPDSNLIAKLCDRHFGIGADGVMTLGPSDAFDCSMRYYNADGSAGEMCGNGGRCFALFARDLGIGGETVRFESLDGPHTAHFRSVDRFRATVELGMIDVEHIVAGDGWWFLNTGVPHYVEFTDHIAQVDVTGRGRLIRRDTSRFPEGTNVNFVQYAGEGRLLVRTYERGVEAETFACGTGATAAALVANFVLQPAMQRFEVDVRGGKLTVAFDREGEGPVYRDIRLAGEARRVFSGVFHSDNF